MATGLLARLRDAGLSVSRNGDQLIVIPRQRLTDELRSAIRDGKGELLTALAGEQAPQPPDLNSRIRRMATRWGFSANELADELSRASLDPTRALLWIERDESRFGDGESLNVRH